MTYIPIGVNEIPKKSRYFARCQNEWGHKKLFNEAIVGLGSKSFEKTGSPLHLELIKRVVKDLFCSTSSSPEVNTQ